MSVTSTTNWTLNPAPDKFNMSLDVFATTEVPDLEDTIGERLDLADLTKLAQCIQQPDFFNKLAWCRKNDLSPNEVDDKKEALRIFPYSEMKNQVQPGDLVVFLEKDSSYYWKGVDISNPLSNENAINTVKQRGRHMELITREEGTLYMHGLWGEIGGNTMRCPVSAIATHAMRLQSSTKESWFNFHVFRLSLPTCIDAESFARSIEAWVKLFPAAYWPRNKKWELDAADFTTIQELHHLSEQIISAYTNKTKPDIDMFCAQWAHAILCLALCYPLNENALKKAGLPTDLAVDFDPLSSLPIQPYTPQDVLHAFLNVYFGTGWSFLTDKPLVSIVFKAVKKKFNLPADSFPKATVLPIFPLWECKHQMNANNLPVEYVGTFLDDKYCMRQEKPKESGL